MFTLRFYVLSLGIPALLLLSLMLPGSEIVAGVYAAGLFALALLDRQVAQRERIEVTRTHDAKLSLGAANPITLQVRSRAARHLNLIVRDEPPVIFSIAHPAHASSSRTPAPDVQPLVVAPRETDQAIYYARPPRRGDFAFGDLHVRWNAPLGLWTRQQTFPASGPVKVYPNLYEIRKYDLLVRRDQLSQMGLRNVRLRGEGTAFESLREYTPDDSYRSINWKATARRGKPISTDYEPERSQRVMVLLDVGRMMRSPLRVTEPDGTIWEMAKVDFVINSVLLFAYVAALKGDQIGLLVFADSVIQYIEPKPGRAQFTALLEAMYALESQPVEADYARALNYLRAQAKKRALMVLFTDVSGARAADMLVRHFPRLAPRHVPLLVTLRDPAVSEQAHQSPQDSDAVYRRAVAEQLLDERRLLLETLRQRGVLTVDSEAEHLTMDLVNRYLQIKARQMA
jgi:uncharacterized protein (DUF58 family)